MYVRYKCGFLYEKQNEQHGGGECNSLVRGKYIDIHLLQRNCTSNHNWPCCVCYFKMINSVWKIIERFSRAGPRGRGRGWATLGEHPLTWLLSNNRLEKVPFVSVLHTSSNRLLLSNQDKGCTPSVAHSLPLPLGPALLNLWNINILKQVVWET